MLEAIGNLWKFEGIHCITTNGFVKNDGCAVMGRGCAKEASDKYPTLAGTLGNALNMSGNRVRYFPEYNLITFPVKDVWWNKADLSIIAESAEQLSLMLRQEPSITHQVYLPRPGCGNGWLDWRDVKPLIFGILNNQVTVITF